MAGQGLKGHLGRWWDQMRGGRAEDDVEENDNYDIPLGHLTEPQSTLNTRKDTFRVAAIKGSITVTQIANFGDTQKVADRLKAGEPQIVNLEHTSAEVSERLIDFLNGVTYALDGFVEKVAENAYLFTPSHIAIHAEGGETQEPTAKTYFNR